MSNFNSETNLVITCIILAYNEEKNIGRVLEVIIDYKQFNEIIIIDDDIQIKRRA